MVARILKVGGLWLAICAIVWLAAIWRWQNTGHEPGNGEIIGQLFLLPVLLAAVVLAALWAVKRIREKASAPVDAPTASLSGSAAGSGAAAAMGAGGDASAHEDAERLASAWIVADAVHLPCGDASDGAWAALRTRSIRPALDAELQDAQGAPVMASRVPDLDVVDAFADAQALVPDEAEALSLGAQRALALLVSPLRQLLATLADLPLHAVNTVNAVGAGIGEDGTGGRAHAGSDAEPMKAHLSGVGVPVSATAQRSREAMAPQLTVRVLLPSHWQDAEREAVVASLRRQSGALLDWAQAAQARGVQWRTAPLERPEAFWDELDQTLVQWSRQTRPELLMVLAVDSALDEACIDRMQAVGELFTATHQTGRMPGEGAVGLLLANAHWPSLAEQGDRMPSPPVRMWRPVRARRDKSADAVGRVGITALQTAVTHAAGLCQADKDKLVVVADADHRASRCAELYESLQEALPGLDPMVSVACMGESFGDLGMARAIAPTALACAALRSGEPPAERALAVHMQSSHDRAVVALAPWMAPAA